MAEPLKARIPASERDALESSVDPSEVRAVSAWVQQWSRTLKNWRLYGARNSTMEKFRADLAAGLSALLDAHGPLTLRFTTDAVLWRESPVHQARTREDNLSLVFFRDGIRSLTFAPGMEPVELETILAAILRATDRAHPGEEDLVMLLWDAELPHLDMHYVSAEATLELEEQDGGGEPAGGAGGGSPLAWPRGAGGSASEPVTLSLVPPPTVDTPASATAPPPDSTTTRSEDWASRDPSAEIVQPFDELDRLAATEVPRFLRERAEENATGRNTATLALLASVFDNGIAPSESAELAPLLERLLLDALTRGAWDEAQRTSQLLHSRPHADGMDEAWLSALMHDDSIVTSSVLHKLDGQSQAEVGAFLRLVATLGSRGLDWYLRILAESTQQRVRRPLARAIAEVAGPDIPRLARWLTDPRWYVVRNIVHILQWIGGDATVPPLRAAMTHADRRVRMEVLAVLSKASPEVARPLLLEMLATDDTRVLSGALRLLAVRRDAEVAGRILEIVRDSRFLDFPMLVQRAVLSALGATGDDTLLAAIGELLDPPRKPSHEATASLQGLAMCVARIATPAATDLLLRAQKSRWQVTREAAALALVAGGTR